MKLQLSNASGWQPDHPRKKLQSSYVAVASGLPFVRFSSVRLEKLRFGSHRQRLDPGQLYSVAEATLSGEIKPALTTATPRSRLSLGGRKVWPTEIWRQVSGFLNWVPERRPR